MLDIGRRREHSIRHGRCVLCLGGARGALESLQEWSVTADETASATKNMSPSFNLCMANIVPNSVQLGDGNYRIELGAAHGGLGFSSVDFSSVLDV